MAAEGDPEITAASEAQQAQPYRTLPERVPLEETVASQEADAAPDPTMGRDTEQEFMLRNAGG